MANFSGAIKISDLNDFITPSQECVKPVVIERTDDTSVRNKSGFIKVEEDGSYTATQDGGKAKKLEKVEITLNDCLACSGCVTTAETILVSQQSKEQFYTVLEQNKTNIANKLFVVVSLSPPSVASLAAQYRLPIQETYTNLRQFLKYLGVDYVIDTSFANDLCIVQSCHEFVERYKQKDDNKTSLPMLAAQCPGWVCYAEKTHGSYILPHLSKVKSPQQITGSLVKNHLVEKLQLRPSDVYHVSVMSCYDKKLEASRPDFYNDNYSTRDVDCVLTTGEIMNILQDKDFDLRQTIACDNFLTQVDSSIGNIPGVLLTENSLMYKQEGGASGGYLHHIAKYAAEHLFGLKIDSLQYKVMRNQDMQEVTVEQNGEVLLRLAMAYGFRNIQLIVQKIKRGKCPYDYVEVMACPSGCNNGGGQITSLEAGETQKERLHAVTELYKSLETRDPHENELVTKAMDQWLGGCNSDKSVAMLETQYHAVEKTENLINIAW